MIENPPLPPFSVLPTAGGYGAAPAALVNDARFVSTLPGRLADGRTVPFAPSSLNVMNSSSSGIGCATQRNAKQSKRQTRRARGGKGTAGTDPSVDFVLLALALLLDHEQRVVEQERLQLAAVALRAPAAVQRALVDQLPPVLLQP